ncbi:MAG: hypothetical protein LBP26_00080 [Clostridiales bacterium]|jgi:hypothetical protein|nr:hypothetical protein [Clostridiales bacterium]
MRIKKRNKISLIAIAAAFIITTAFALGAFTSVKSATAAGELSDIKFKQVVAGEDFAIGLTYKGDLYGWSLRGDADEWALNTSGTTDANPANDDKYTKTLGQYYPKNPIKINVNLSARTDWQVGSLNNQAKEVIKKLAATRTTAAFITDDGSVFTWGLDEKDEPDEGISGSTGVVLQQKGLLYRRTGVNTADYRSNNNFYEPWHIEYKTYVFPGTAAVVPFIPNDYITSPGADDIVGGPDNYAVKIKNTGKFIGWGSSYYRQLYELGFPRARGAKVYGADFTDMYIGAGFVIGRKSATEYLLQGRNFYMPNTTAAISAAVTEAGTGSAAVYQINSPTAVSTITDTHPASGGTRNAYFNFGAARPVEIKNALIGAPTAVSGTDGVDLFGVSPSVQGYSAGFTDSETTTAASVPQSAISLGTGYGYYIKGGTVQFWGNAYNGENGSGSAAGVGTHVSALTPTSITNAVQVVAGQYGSKIKKYAVDGTNIKPSHIQFLSHRSHAAAVGSANVNGLNLDLTFNAADYADKGNFISAALLTGGVVKAWSDGKAPDTVDFNAVLRQNDGNDESNRITALVPGYGHNLFALSKLGKVYRITRSGGGFTVSLIDKFSNGTDGAIDNWTAAESGMRVTFADGYQSLSDKTVEVRAEYTHDSALESHLKTNDVTDAETDAAAGPSTGLVTYSTGRFITGKATADAFRIMLASSVKVYNPSLTEISSPFNDGIQTFISGQSNAGVGAVTYFYKSGSDPEKPMSPEAAAKYFDVKPVYDASRTLNGTPKPEIYFKITPLASTKNMSVVMRFWIGRYDHSSAFTLTNNFYDAKQVSLTVTVGNTQAAVNSGFNNAPSAGNDPVPPLDPNNPKNNTYSIAAQNVSAGFAAITSAVDGYSGADASGLSDTIKTAAYAADPGFPHSSKRNAGAGDLDFYLGADGGAAYYNGEYLFLASDPDGDRVQIDGTAVFFDPGAKNGTGDVRVKAVTLTLNLSGYIDGGLTVNKLKALFVGTESNFDAEFRNVYGFYNIAVLDGDDPETAGVTETARLRFTYEVIEISAKVSTGSVEYERSGGGNALIDKPKFTDAAALNDKFRCSLKELSDRYAYSGGQYAVGQNQTSTLSSSAYVKLHVQASLTVKSAVTDASNHSGKVFGKSGHNVYNHAQALAENNPTNNPINTNIELGSTARSVKVPIGYFFNDVSDYSGIMFTYDGKGGSDGSAADAYAAFKAGFDKYKNIISIDLSPSEITFSMTAEGTVPFAVEVTRFGRGRELNNPVNPLQDKIAFDNAERVIINFNVTCKPSLFGLLSAADQTLKHLTISAPRDIDIRERVNAATGAFADIFFGEHPYVFSADTDVDAVLTVKVSDDKKTLRLIPKRSGSVNVTYTVRRYAEVLSDSFRVTVEAVAQMPAVYSVATPIGVPIEELKAYVVYANQDSGISAGGLSVDRDDETGDPGFYVQQKTDFLYDANGDPVKDGDGAHQKSGSAPEWKTVKTDHIPFLKSVSIVSDASGEKVRVEVNNVIGAYDGAETRVVVKFVHESNGKRFAAALRVVPGNVLLANPSGDGGAFVLEIVYKQPFEGQDADADIPQYSPENHSVTVPLKYITKMLPGGANYDNAKIAWVQGQEGYDKYFNFYPIETGSGAAVVFTPDYPTKDLPGGMALVSVSINNNDVNNVVMFYVRVSGIRVELERGEYSQIFMFSAIAVFVLLFLVFIARVSVYASRRAQQRRIIRKNQMLIKMRDKLHNKNNTATKDEIVRTRLKMNNPKYAQMFDEMRKSKEAETGVSLDNSVIAKNAAIRTEVAADKSVVKDAAKKKTKKGGKRSLADLKAELEAKRVALAQMKVTGVPPTMATDDGAAFEPGIPGVDVEFDSTDDYKAELSREDVESQIQAKLAEENFITYDFDVDVDDGGKV